jgi:hypothetical protein
MDRIDLSWAEADKFKGGVSSRPPFSVFFAKCTLLGVLTPDNSTHACMFVFWTSQFEVSQQRSTRDDRPISEPIERGDEGLCGEGERLARAVCNCGDSHICNMCRRPLALKSIAVTGILLSCLPPTTSAASCDKLYVPVSLKSASRSTLYEAFHMGASSLSLSVWL